MERASVAEMVATAETEEMAEGCGMWTVASVLRNA